MHRNIKFDLSNINKFGSINKLYIFYLFHFGDEPKFSQPSNESLKFCKVGVMQLRAQLNYSKLNVSFTLVKRIVYEFGPVCSVL